MDNLKYIFITSNSHKVEEVKQYFPKVKQLNLDLREIRSDSFEEIAKAKLEEALMRFHERDVVIFVEDSGLEIEALNGFPGTYSAWVYKKIGCKGILKLMEDKTNRKARFVTVISAYIPWNQKIVIAKGEVKGEISNEMRGSIGFGFDPIFIPEGYDKTFAEDKEMKKKVSHRKKAWELIFKLLK